MIIHLNSELNCENAWKTSQFFKGDWFLIENRSLDRANTSDDLREVWISQKWKLFSIIEFQKHFPIDRGSKIKKCQLCQFYSNHCRIGFTFHPILISIKCSLIGTDKQMNAFLSIDICNHFLQIYCFESTIFVFHSNCNLFVALFFAKRNIQTISCRESVRFLWLLFL